MDGQERRIAYNEGRLAGLDEGMRAERKRWMEVMFSCHVCGQPMHPKVWDCAACGAATAPLVTGESLIEQAARSLVNQLHIMHADERYQRFFDMAAAQGVFYRGLHYESELHALELALKSRVTHPGAPSKEKP